MLPDIALANVAWCAEGNNCYPLDMLKQCFAAHTAPLLKVLKPHLILLGGGGVSSFKARVKAVCPEAQIELVLHYSHRKGHEATRKEIERVRPIIQRAWETFARAKQ